MFELGGEHVWSMFGACLEKEKSDTLRRKRKATRYTTRYAHALSNLKKRTLKHDEDKSSNTELFQPFIFPRVYSTLYV